MLRFFDFLFPPREDELVLRDVSEDAFLPQLTPRFIPETRPGTTALLPLNSMLVRAAIHEAKYHGSAHAFNLLALSLAEYLREADENIRKPVIVPVPLGKVRHKERGFNQVEEVVWRAAKELGITVDTTLVERTRETASQVSLARTAREENMRDAFRATHAADSARTYIVVDDVLTTGATLQAVIVALQKAGAAHLVPIALAH